MHSGKKLALIILVQSLHTIITYVVFCSSLSKNEIDFFFANVQYNFQNDKVSQRDILKIITQLMNMILLI